MYDKEDKKCVLVDKLNYDILKNKYSWNETENATIQGNVFFDIDCDLKFVDNSNSKFSGSYILLSDIR
jgi:hypothetical protein